MKPHLIVKLRPGYDAEMKIPFWAKAISNKSSVPIQLLPSMDRLFRQFNIPIWVTREFPSLQKQWTIEEKKNGLSRFYRLVLQRNQRIPQGMIRKIRLLPEVSYARMGDIVRTGLPVAQDVVEEFGARRKTDQGSRDSIRLEQAQRESLGHPKILIAVLDTGFDLEHPDLKHAFVKGRDFVNIIHGAEQFIGDYTGYDPLPEDKWVGHGTHVAGIIGAKGKNMPMGVAPKCPILPIRVLGAMKRGDKLVGAGSIDNINVALKWAIDKGSRIINMSLGVRHTHGGLPYKEVINYARSKGATIVAASGNNGMEDLYYPGAYPYVMTVGALDTNVEQVAPFSTFGRQVDMVAPGTDIYSAFLRHGYAFSSGTSHAAPFVTGTVALLKSYARSKGRELTDKQVKAIFRHTSDKLDRRIRHPKAGYGRLNAGDAMQLLSYRLN